MPNNVIQKVYNGGNEYLVGGGSAEGAEVVYLTQAEYDALPASKLTDGKIYKVKTSGSVPTPGSRTPIETISATANTQYDIPVGATRICFVSTPSQGISGILNGPLEPFMDNPDIEFWFCRGSSHQKVVFTSSNKVWFNEAGTIYFY